MSQGRICVYEQGRYGCVDYCSQNNMPKAVAGECSVDFEYCDAVTLDLETNRCDECGCPKNHECLSDGSCRKVCSDGTPVGGCSAIHLGKKCSAGLEFVDDCLSCGGCPLFKSYCGLDGECHPLILWGQVTYEDFSLGSFSSVELSEEPENIALLGVAFASSTLERQPDMSYTPDVKYFNDGNWGYPMWMSASDKNEHIGMMWDEPVKFNKVLMHSDYLNVRKYKVQYLSSERWVDISDVQFVPSFLIDYPDVDALNEVPYNERFYELVFNEVESEGIRVLLLECTTAMPCHVNEFEVYNTRPSYITIKNLALQGTYTSPVYDTKTLKGTVEYDKIYFDFGGVYK